MRTTVLFLLLVLLFSGCSDDDDQPEYRRVDITYDFSTGTEGWMGDFADYPAGEEESYDLIFEHSRLPEPLNTTEGALKLSGKNYSDDLFMFIKKEISGLVPNKEYRLNFEVEFASNVATGQSGIGGSPGESVYLKAGASPTEPQKQEDEDGWYRLDIDKGNQAEGGEDMVVIGNFANGTEENIYTLKSVSTSAPLQVTTGSEGRLWLLFGTDSGFEGETTIYINKIKIELY